jgi:hypothetical protein
MNANIPYFWCILVGIIVQIVNICAQFLDGSSRKVFAAGEFGRETIHDALLVLKKVCWKYGLLWYLIRAVLTDYGS